MSDNLIRFPDPEGDAEARAWSIGNGGEFAFIPPYMAACYRAAFVYAVWQGAAAPVPPAVYDQTDEDGNTPRDSDGSLRHPAGAHDFSERMGQNSDMGYPLTVADGNPWAGSDNDGTHLTGPPDRLDINCLAHVVAALVWQELQAVDAGLITSLWRIINVDGQIRQPLIDALSGLGLAQRTLDRCQEVIHGELTDQGTGWFSFHGDHLHSRANFFEGDTADALAALWGKREQFELDAIKGGDASAPAVPHDPPADTQPPHTDAPPVNPAGPGAASPGGENEGPGSGGTAPAPGDSVPATPTTPAPRIPEGATKAAPDTGWRAIEENAVLWVPGTKASPTPMPPLLLRVPGVTIIAEEPGGFYVKGGRPVSGEDFACGLRGMGAHHLRWDGGDVRDSGGRNWRLTDSEEVILANATSAGSGVEAWQFGNCPKLRMTNCRAERPGPPKTSRDRMHFIYGSGNMDGSLIDGFWGDGYPGSAQFNGGGFGDHVIKGLTCRNFYLSNGGSDGTPAWSLMAVADSLFENWLVEKSNAGLVMFDDGRGSDYGVRGNTFRNIRFADLAKWAIHLQVGGGNTWIGLKGAAVPDGDIDGGPGTGTAAPPPTSTNPQVHPHAGDWPTDPHPGMVVEMTPGAYGELELKGYAGVTVRAVGPVTAKALVVGEGCAGLRFELWPERNGAEA